MKTDVQEPPEWLTPLGMSVSSFLATGIVYAIIGFLGLVIIWRNGSGNVGGYFFSREVDSLIFGRSPAEMNAQNPVFAAYMSRLMIVFCSFMVPFGIMQTAVAWYSLRAGEPWALWTSVVANLFMLAVYWFIVIIPVLREYKVGYFDLYHPYAMVPTVLVPVGAILGWIGLRR